MNDAKPMSKDQLRHRRLQGLKLSEQAKSGAHGTWQPEDMVSLFTRAFDSLWLIDNKIFSREPGVVFESPPCKHFSIPAGAMIRRQAS